MTEGVKTRREEQTESALTHFLIQMRNPDEAVRNVAWEALYRYSVKKLRPIVAGKVNRRAQWIDISDVFAEAADGVNAYLLKGKIANTQKYRAMFVQIATYRACTRIRKAVALQKAMKAMLTRPVAPPQDNALFEILELFWTALLALRQWEENQAAPEDSDDVEQAKPPPTPNADAVSAAFLGTIDPLFLLDERKPLTVDTFLDKPLTFLEIGALLEVKPAKAHKRFWAGINWLRLHYPDLDTLLPVKQKSGRKKRGTTQAEEEGP